jgi:hypothetical protein
MQTDRREMKKRLSLKNGQNWKWWDKVVGYKGYMAVAERLELDVGCRWSLTKENGTAAFQLKKDYAFY